MNAVLEEIVDLLNVEPIERNLYRGRNHSTEHVFGGQVLAQAIAASFRTVEAPHTLHSIHAYFLRAGDWQAPILYDVPAYATAAASPPAGWWPFSTAAPSST